jgi:RimJ/RimL family protein N-acetyltransferase
VYNYKNYKKFKRGRWSVMSIIKKPEDSLGKNLLNNKESGGTKKTHKIKHRLVRALVIFCVLGVPLGYIGYQYYTGHYGQHERYTPITVAPEEVKGKIITLRKLKEEYFIDYHNMFSSTVRRLFEFPEHIDLDYTINFLHYEMEKERKGKQVFYCIFDNKDNKLIGHIDIREKVTDHDDLGQFGWWVNENYWGGGRAQEAFKLIKDVYFSLTNAQSFEIHVRLWNQRSYKALKKCGCKDAGYFYENGKPTRYILECHREK